MIDNIFIFDNVIHVVDVSAENARGDEGEAGRQSMLAVGDALRHPSSTMGVEQWDTKWSTDAMYDLVFNHSSTDMAMAQAVPIFDWYKDGFAPVAAQHAMAAAYPERVLFCGGADPNYHGVEGALDEIERQITEMGAVSIKFYNGHVRDSWACDDEKLAYPMYQKCLDLGVDVVQFHKGAPFHNQPLAPLSPLDIERAAIDFPDMRFIIHHLSVPFFEETVSIGGRHQNVYLALSANLNMLLFAPRMVQMQMGRLLGEVGVHKLLWGSEAALAGSPEPYIRAFLEMEIPQDLREGYGFPQITREDKERILGLNFAAMMGIDVQAKVGELAAAAA